jgi:hypothetical protein
MYCKFQNDIDLAPRQGVLTIPHKLLRNKTVSIVIPGGIALEVRCTHREAAPSDLSGRNKKPTRNPWCFV